MNCIFYGCKSLIIFPDVSKWNINKDKKKSIDSLFEESSSNNKCSSENEILNSESNISENNSDNYIFENIKYKIIIYYKENRFKNRLFIFLFLF